MSKLRTGLRTRFEQIVMIVSGVVIAIAAYLLQASGNPKNMGFCIACFIRDIAGGLKFHNAGVVQYIRPEIIGLILGSFIISVARGEFKPRGGSSPLLRFIIGAMVMIGALVFLGCPLRMIIRLSAGDLNALVALFGFVAGIGIGVMFLNNGFSLGRAEKKLRIEAVSIPFIQIILLTLLIFAPAILAFSEKGPGSQHAPLYYSLLVALIVGAVAQSARICCAGGVRDIYLSRDFTLFLGPLFIFVALLVLNLINGNFNLSFTNQPIAHSDHIWNFLGMFVVGLGSTMIGGCPLRQLVLSGEGNTDSFMAVLGMVAGAAISHNFSLAGVANKGATPNGKFAILAIIVLLLLIGVFVTYKNRKGEQNA